MRLKTKIYSATLALVLMGGLSTIVACSSSSGGSNSGSSSAFSEAQAALEAAVPDISATAFTMTRKSAQPKADVGILAAISGVISVTNQFPDPDGGSNVNSLVEYIEKMYSDSNSNAIFSRANTPFLIACTIDALATKTGDLYDSGSQTMTVDADELSQCGSSSDYGGVDGTSVVAVFAATADTTLYDNYVQMTEASNPQFGGNEQYMYVRNNSTTLNFAHYEMDDVASPTSVSVTYLQYNKSTGAGTFQYISKNSNVYNLFRIAMDPVSNDMRVFTYVLNDVGSTDQLIITSGASTSSSQTHAAMSFSWENVGAADMADGNACLAISGAASIQADNNLTCAANSKTVAAASTASALITHATSTRSIADLALYGSSSAAGDDVIATFDDTNILTSTTGF